MYSKLLGVSPYLHMVLKHRCQSISPLIIVIIIPYPSKMNEVREDGDKDQKTRTKLNQKRSKQNYVFRFVKS